MFAKHFSHVKKNVNASYLVEPTSYDLIKPGMEKNLSKKKKMHVYYLGNKIKRGMLKQELLTKNIASLHHQSNEKMNEKNKKINKSDPSFSMPIPA